MKTINVLFISIILVLAGCSNPQKEHSRRMEAMTRAHERQVAALKFAAEEADEARKLGVTNVVSEPRTVVVQPEVVYAPVYDPVVSFRFWGSPYPYYTPTYYYGGYWGGGGVRHHHHHIHRDNHQLNQHRGGNQNYGNQNQGGGGGGGGQQRGGGGGKSHGGGGGGKNK